MYNRYNASKQFKKEQTNTYRNVCLSVKQVRQQK